MESIKCLTNLFVYLLEFQGTEPEEHFLKIRVSKDVARRIKNLNLYYKVTLRTVCAAQESKAAFNHEKVLHKSLAKYAYVPFCQISKRECFYFSSFVIQAFKDHFVRHRLLQFIQDFEHTTDYEVESFSEILDDMKSTWRLRKPTVKIRFKMPITLKVKAQTEKIKFIGNFCEVRTLAYSKIKNAISDFSIENMYFYKDFVAVFLQNAEKEEFLEEFKDSRFLYNELLEEFKKILGLNPPMFKKSFLKKFIQSSLKQVLKELETQEHFFATVESKEDFRFLYKANLLLALEDFIKNSK